MRTVEIDRFEEDYVVCELENGDMINILKSKFWNIKKKKKNIKT